MPKVTTKSAQIREQLGHPVIDGDGHIIELVPAFRDFVVDHGRADLVEKAPMFKMGPESRRANREMSLEERRRRGYVPGFWIVPGETDYWATVTTPALYHERLGEAGIDFSVLYPTMGLHIPALADEELRIPLSRLYNEFMAEQYRPYADRLTVAAGIPMHTPEEAIAAAEHAVSLGAKVLLIPTYVRRPLGDVDEGYAPGFFGGSTWLDSYGLDSAHDYDRLWAKVTELGLPLACHSNAMGFVDRANVTNYVYNHLGHFAAAGETLAKSLFLGGVTRRFPRLRVALLEGGVTVGMRIFSDLVTHWEKRGAHAVARYDPSNLDRARIGRLLTEKDARLGRYSVDELIGYWSSPDDRRDDFALAEITSVEDIRDRFCESFYWGCEADDPFVALAWDPRLTPLGARVPAIMGSDIGHWDVPEFDSPLAEAYELVERGLLDGDALRDFVFTNPLRCYASLNPDFFKGTAIERETAAASAA
jgi:predicted TIM-barrel fold metal-dependent hydrolase